MEVIGIGVDLCEVQRMERELAGEGGGFGDAVFTAAEIADCTAREHPSRHFAARFAAKEAVFKALAGAGATTLVWREIEVASADRSDPQVVLRGATARLAEERGVGSVTVSLSHTRELAIAWAVAVASSRPGPHEREVRQ